MYQGPDEERVLGLFCFGLFVQSLFLVLSAFIQVEKRRLDRLNRVDTMMRI